MRGLSLFVAAGALLAASALSAQAMPIAAPAPGADASPAALVKVADGCGPGRFRGVGGYCEGHRPITVRRVCRVVGYPGAMVRRCHTERVRALPYHPHLGPRY